ncbi:hypothetical protein SCALM49S_06894 [Streptomyces californicus]
MLTPRMPGSASGLRVTPCMTPPARPSAAPMTTARTVRGMRLVAAACQRVARAPENPEKTGARDTAGAPRAGGAPNGGAGARGEKEPQKTRAPRGPGDGVRRGAGVERGHLTLSAASARAAA